jgi:hypothetical protein
MVEWYVSYLCHTERKFPNTLLLRIQERKISLSGLYIFHSSYLTELYNPPQDVIIVAQSRPVPASAMLVQKFRFFDCVGALYGNLPQVTQTGVQETTHYTTGGDVGALHGNLPQVTQTGAPLCV